MAPKPLLVAAGLLLASGAAFAWLRSSAGDTAPIADRAGEALVPPPPATSTPEQPPARTAAVAPTIDTPRPFADDAESVEILVVDRATQTPVPGATVRWFDESSSGYVRERMQLTHTETRLLRDDCERLADLGGWRTWSGPRGRARVTIASDTTILADHDGRHGQLVVRGGSVPPSAGHTIELEDDRVLRVRVLDASGEPCGDTLVVIGSDAESVGPTRIARTRDGDGIAIFRHLQMLAREAGATSEWKAWPGLLGRDDPAGRVAFSIDDPPSEPLDLRLPPTGSVRARAEFAGHPVPGIQEIKLWHQERYTLHQTSAGVDSDGWARFRHVPLGLELDAVAYWLGGCKLQGPRSPGEAVDVVVRPEPTRVTWTGRLLATDRTPAIDQPVSVWIACEGHEPTQQPTCTDANGRFVIGLLRHDPGERAERISFEWRSRSGRTMCAELAPRMLRSGVEDLGDVTPATPPLIVAGRILGVAGATRDSVALRVERHAPSACAPDTWEDVRAALIERDPDGAFTIRGAIPPGRHRLAVGGRVQPIEPIEFALGRGDLSIELEAGHDFAAGLLLPRGIPPELVRVQLVPPATTAMSALQRDRLAAVPRPQLGERHDVQWTAIAAGTYTLELRPLAMTAPVLRIPDVLVPPPPGGDPRLADVDLRQLVPVTSIQLVTSDVVTAGATSPPK